MEIRYPDEEELKKVIKIDNDSDFAFLNDEKYYLVAYSDKTILGVAPLIISDDALIILGLKREALRPVIPEAQEELLKACLQEALDQDLLYVNYVYVENEPPKEIQTILSKLGFSAPFETKLGGLSIKRCEKAVEGPELEPMDMLIYSDILGHILEDEFSAEQ